MHVGWELVGHGALSWSMVFTCILIDRLVEDCLSNMACDFQRVISHCEVNVFVQIRVGASTLKMRRIDQYKDYIRKCKFLWLFRLTGVTEQNNVPNSVLNPGGE